MTEREPRGYTELSYSIDRGLYCMLGSVSEDKPAALWEMKMNGQKRQVIVLPPGCKVDVIGWLGPNGPAMIEDQGKGWVARGPDTPPYPRRPLDFAERVAMIEEHHVNVADALGEVQDGD